MALTRKGTAFTWTSERQDVFMALKSCLLQAPVLGFLTEADRCVLDMDAGLFVVGGALNQIQGDLGGDDHLCQPDSLAVSTPVLYYTSRNVGRR